MGPRAFIRRHPPPAPRAAAELQALVRGLGFPDFDMGSSGALQASLLRLAEQGVSVDTIRCVLVYVCVCVSPSVTPPPVTKSPTPHTPLPQGHHGAVHAPDAAR